MLRKLRFYLRHCSTCQLNQTKRYKSYNELISISFSSFSFYIIIMNFILILSNMNDNDTMFILIDKISHQLQFIIDKVIFFVFDWVNVVMNRVQLINWNISKIIIFDRDSKFTFEFWIVFFHRLNTNLFMNNAYHSQTNDLFERSNQTIKITFRYLITQYFDINWVKTLSTFQSYFNNVFNVIIDKSSNEVIYDFKIRDVFVVFIKQITFTNREFERFRHQKKIVDVTFYVIVMIWMI